MRKAVFSLLLFFAYSIQGQVMVICHLLLNNNKLTNTNVYVWTNGVYTQTLNTKNKNEITLDLDFGRQYRVYLQNQQCPLMFFEVFADDIPREKLEYTMSHEFNAMFVHKADEDIDTSIFSKPFYRIRFDGKKRMIDDTTYNNEFVTRILKKSKKDDNTNNAAPVILAGKVFMGAKSDLPARNKHLSLISKKGLPMATTATNRYGAFSFTNIKMQDAGKLKMEIRDAEAAGHPLHLMTSAKKEILSTRAMAGICEWDLGEDLAVKLVDNNYSNNIGGKLVMASSKEKKFFANKEVYLSNKHNTIIKKTTTNVLGTFVFEDIKPDHQYYLGVSHNELKPGERVDLLSKEDQYIATLDTVAGERNSVKVLSSYNKIFNDLSIGDEEMKMDIKGTIFGDNVNNPIGKLKIILLNDGYEPIDSALTDNLGTFKFKYLPYLKRFYLSADNKDNVLDVFKNILIYSSDNNLIKIMTHQKGKKFTYNPVAAELSRLRDIELEDPWLELLDKKEKPPAAEASAASPAPVIPKKPIMENIMFETNKFNLTGQAEEILDKIIIVMNANKNFKVEIGAHTDSRGSDVANMKLSEMRAKAVTAYIVKAGIDASRVTAKGYGESKLLNDCKDNVPCGEPEHAQNRRTEFRIID
jgi:outer membrane protein OmpA-like peptidoglycan-associated protein